MQKRKPWLLALGLVLAYGLGIAQPANYPVNGVRDERQTLYYIHQVTLHVDDKTTLSNAAVIMQNGKILRAGTGLAKPESAVELNMAGKHVYPGFIDLWSSHGMAEPKKLNFAEMFAQGPQYESNRKGPYTWNQAIKAETRAAALYAGAEAENLRKAGFAAVLTHQPDGIARGTGALVMLADRKPNEDILVADAAAFYSFDKGSSTQQYPGSLMGAIALLRQTMYDAAWYAQGNAAQTDLTLEALNKGATLPQFFEAKDKQAVLRVARIGQEFNKFFIVLGGGDEYQRIEEVKATQQRLLVPINFPLPYKVDDPDEARELPLEYMKHWEMAPFNLGRLEKAGIPFAITAAELKKKDDFLKNLKKAVRYGLSPQAAIAALTTRPAQWLKVDNQLGAIKAGFIANLVITDGDLFEDKTQIIETWSAGLRFVIQSNSPVNLTGKYELQGNNAVTKVKLTISGKPEAYQVSVTKDSVKLTSTFTLKQPEFTLSYQEGKGANKVTTLLQGWLQGTELKGTGNDATGNSFLWTAKRTEAVADTTKPAKPDSVLAPGSVLFPFCAYGREQLPIAKTWVFKNATVWTCEKDGKLTETDVRIEGGKIAAIGKNLSTAGATVVDAKGKHLTPGLIDEHSHISITDGVNEGSQSVTAEVRIGDVVDAEDINMYRQLSGGVIGAQLLHGSANCIGGQSALIKHKWGAAPEQIKIAGADGFIKFALGENVKQTNWGERYTSRFPQTRMGVEQVFVDAFTRAKEYETKWGAFNTSKKGAAPRRDLEEDALLEIVNGKRFVTCHSYIQSEINMLMKTAERFKFRINTFTHILEGYKVADKMKAHGCGGSTFADWWAYKMEVMDAIPHNPSLMLGQGLVTAINSDDAEMGRRLNQEAAKVVKYGGASEEEALKTVTLYPAKLLHLDKRTGSIAIGKDADVVLWNDYPLSVNAKVEKTLIEGAAYFDIEEHNKLKAYVAAERQRLIGKMLAEKLAGGATQPVKGKNKRMYHCEDLGDELEAMKHEGEE